MALAAAVFLKVDRARAEDALSTCDAGGIAVLATPVAPWRGAPLRVLVTAESALDGELVLTAPDGSIAARSRGRQGGPPYFWYVEVAAPAAGTWHAALAGSLPPAGCGAIAKDITVFDAPQPGPRPTPGSLWPMHASWNRATENVYSAWIQKLFDAPLDASPSWKALQDVIRDRSRNMLFNSLGLGEDEMGTVMRPDCADMPYFLRAYFAFKMGLPFGFTKCSRGGGGSPPKCYEWMNIVSASAQQPGQGLGQAFGRYLRVVGDGVQSGAGRTLWNDENTDFYPVALSQETLRPGTIFADPYGHILMIVRRVPQQGGAAGILLSADAEPDFTVARKRFWRGNFLFVHDPKNSGPGFKRFRPIVREANGSLRRLSNAEIARNPDYGDFSLEQAQLGADEFYERMDAVLSPAPLDPMRAMGAAIDALDEQVNARVTAVENGRKYQNTNHGDANMPDGPSIFETTGAWEDFATPARDFRLLIAIDVVRGYPDRVLQHPERYAIPFGKTPAMVKAELDAALAAELAQRKITYTRSDGSTWTLTLKEVVERAGEFEMGYNLNDCVELRWGAPERSEEAATCRRHAPAAQRAKMTDYRTWFRDRRWPTHA
jgi:hypothetical protein